MAEGGFFVRLEGKETVVGEFRRLKQKFKGEVRTVTNLRALQIQKDAKKALKGNGGGIDTGQYRATIQILRFLGGLGAEIGSEDFRSRWLEFGTGIYGPRGQPIRPKRGRFLVFKVKGGSTDSEGFEFADRDDRRSAGSNERLVFAREVRGRPATPHLIPAFEKGEVEYVNDIQKLMARLDAGL